MEVKDTNGNLLQAGDSVVISQDIPVKGSKPIKRWTKIKNIRLGDDADRIEWKVDGTMMVIKTIYVKKN